MDSVTTLQCQNLTCLAPNALANRVCEKCGTPLVKRYLWMMGDWVKTYYHVGDLINERYLVKHPRIALDTKPAQAPQAPDEPPNSIATYLKLLPYRLHIPQVYGYIPSPDDRLNMDLWLLEYSTVPLDSTGELLFPELLPTLSEEWSKASVLRQIHWLWQMARLWQPLQKKGVVSSLLNPSLTRVNGQNFQLLELTDDEAPIPTLKDLGKLWETWIPTASESAQSFLASLVQKLQTGTISQVEPLIAILDQALLHYGRTQKRTYHLFACTDTGPMREHNEDACYPNTPQAVTLEDDVNPLAIVCDGIGGQEGGEIASVLAIETLQKEITHWYLDTVGWNPTAHIQTLEQALRTTNDTISQRNDNERRQERQRMGTTLVMSLGHAHEMYIAHVGDSRVYWITANGCQQVTVDDDLASREVKLGYLLYRDALQYPNAGALVQALGMSSATNLHPTVQRFVLDEDCVFLLCSDGLSDYDRVEQYWDSEIVPLLTGAKTVTEVGERLLELANQKNGHDNATIALVHCQVQPSSANIAPLVYADIEANVFPNLDAHGFDDTLEIYNEDEIFTESPTQPSLAPAVSIPAPVTAPVTVSVPQRSVSLPLITGAIALALGLAGLIGWQFLSRVSQPDPISNSPSPTTVNTPVNLALGQVYKVNTDLLQLQSEAITSPNSPIIPIPANTVVEIVDYSAEQNQVKLKVCSSAVKPIQQGWITVDRLQNSLIPPTAEESNLCKTPAK